MQKMTGKEVAVFQAAAGAWVTAAGVLAEAREKSRCLLNSGLPFAVSSRITLSLGSSSPPPCNSAQSPGVESRHENYEYSHTNCKEEIATQRRVG